MSSLIIEPHLFPVAVLNSDNIITFCVPPQRFYVVIFKVLNFFLQMQLFHILGIAPVTDYAGYSYIKFTCYHFLSGQLQQLLIIIHIDDSIIILLLAQVEPDA